jgi:hypothetical protein
MSADEQNERDDATPPAADDPYADCFHPPSVSTRVLCLHCHEIYDSFLIEWRLMPRGEDGEGLPGHWCCPTPDCTGAGFGFDIYPLDPDYQDPDGREVGSMADFGYYDDDDDESVDAGEHPLFNPDLIYFDPDGERLDGYRYDPGTDFPPRHGGQSRAVRDTDAWEPIPF